MTMRCHRPFRLRCYWFSDSYLDVWHEIRRMEEGSDRDSESLRACERERDD